jgi:hypothetical protein
MSTRADDRIGGDAGSASAQPPAAKRHPLFGWLMGSVRIAPSTNLTEPADPEWAGRIGNECPAPPYVRGRFDRE